MKIISRNIGVALVSAGLVLATGCAIDEHGQIVINNTTVADFFYVNNLKQKAQHGDALAQYTLAGCYAHHGRGVQQNAVEAVNWYRRSAEQGYAPAQNSLGFCYAYGRGVPPNLAEAMRWYQLAANQGYAPAQFHLGLCYEGCPGVAQDHAQAMTWFRQAAAQGYAPATKRLNYYEAMSGGQVNNRPPPPSPTTEPENALTVDEIKVFSSCGSKPDAIIDQIKQTNSRFSPQDIAALQQANVDPAVIDYIKTNAAK